MKFTVDIEIDWIDEESNLDDEIKAGIINGIANKVEKTVMEKVEKKAFAETELKIGNVEEKVNELVSKTFDDFMNNTVGITDGYGDTIKTFTSVRELLKDRFDNFLTESVNDEGNVSSYGGKTQRIKHIIDKQLKTFADEFTTDAVKQVSEEIKHHVNEGLTNKLGAELMRVLKVNKMLGMPEPNGKK